MKVFINVAKRMMPLVLAICLILSMLLVVQFQANAVTVGGAGLTEKLLGVAVSDSTDGGTVTASADGTTITVTMTSAEGYNDRLPNPKLTITNNGSGAALLTFNYVAEQTLSDSRATSFEADGTLSGAISGKGNTSGSYSGTLGAGQSIEIQLRCANGSEFTYQDSNGCDKDGESNATYSFSITDIKIQGTITFGAIQGPAGSGSYTVVTGSESQTVVDAAYERTDAFGTSYTLTAAATEGFVLVGWYSGDVLLSMEDTYTVTNQGAYTIYPRFSAPNATIEFAAPQGNGSYTVNGEAAPVSKNDPVHTSYTLVATPGENYAFSCWRDSKGNIISSESSCTIVSTVDETIYPVFVPADMAVFGVGDMRFYDLNEADAYATSLGGAQITLLDNGKLYSGEYTISAGNTLLIPYEDTYTARGHYPESKGFYQTNSSEAGYMPPPAQVNKCYRKLTMDTGAKIIVDGALEVGCAHISGSSPGGCCGTPYGDFGQIDMASGSNITVNNGGYLYAWGFITGSGTVDILFGGTVYEYFQIMDFRGGTATTKMVTSIPIILPSELPQYRVFPFSQYFVQNVEVEMTLYYGAQERVYGNIAMNESDNPTEVLFIGTSGAMFNMGEGTWVTKDYDPETDRLILSSNGESPDCNLSLSKMSVSFNFVVNIKVDSSKFVLPLTSNITININSGSVTITEDVALLPGCVVNVDYGAQLFISEGAEVFVYDRVDWVGKGFVQSVTDLRTVAYSPTAHKTRTSADLADAVLNINGYVRVEGDLYTTAGGGAIISSEGTGIIEIPHEAGQTTTTYQVTQTGSDPLQSAIAVNNAWLQNADGSYVEIAGELDGEYGGATYFYDNGKWGAYTTVSYDPNGGTGTTPSASLNNWYDILELPEFDDNGDIIGDGDGDGYYGEKVPYELEVAANGFVRTGYTFIGWNTKPDGTGTAYAPGDIIAITCDVTLYAQWQVNTYDAVFDANGGSWDDGTTSQTVPGITFGTAITAPANPTRVGYTFAGWSPAVGNMTAEGMTFVAQWTVNVYTINWSVDGNVSTTDQTYGAALVLPADPVKAGYTFLGWYTGENGSGEQVTAETVYTIPADTTYYANFVKNYTVQVNLSGVVIDTVANAEVVPGNGFTYTYTFGEGVTVDTAHTNLMYTDGVSVTINGTKTTLYTYDYSTNTITISAEDMTGDVVINVWTKYQSYNVTWIIDGVETTETYEYGAAIVVPTPSKVGHTFTGWDEEVPTTMPARDLVITALWQINQYTITFDTVGGTVIDSITLDYGAAITAPADPVKEGHTFTGWDAQIPTTMPAEDMTITALWQINQYTVTWNVNGEIIVHTYDYGAAIVALADPVRTGYTFTGWDKTVPATMPAEDLTFTDTWQINQYNLNFYVNGTLIGTLPVDYQTRIDQTYLFNNGPAVHVEGHSLVEWRTDTWGNSSFYVPANDVNLYASLRVNSYELTWIIDGVQTSEWINYGTTLTAPADPTKEGHTFTGWIGDEIPATMPANALTITLNSTWTVNSYTVTWIIDGVITTETYLYGAAITAPAEPSKEGHTFTGWDAEVPTVMGAEDLIVVLNATWSVNSYTVTWIVDGVETEETYEYGTAIVVPAPSKEGHTFTGWDAEIPATMPAEDLTFTATWSVNRYTIIFKAGFENADGSQKTIGMTLNYGSFIPNVTFTREGYHFVGWMDENGNDVEVPASVPAQDMVFVAKWEINTYDVIVSIQLPGAEPVAITYQVTHGSSLTALVSEWNLSSCTTIQSLEADVAFNYDGVRLVIDNVTGDLTVTVYLMESHTIGHMAVENYKAPTCLEEGSYDLVAYCFVCGEKIHTTHNTIDPTGHDYKEVYTAPTFEADGYTTYTCAHCGDTYTVTDESTMLIAVAQIGETKYTTLEAALEAAKRGDTVILLTKATIAETTEWYLDGITLQIPAVEDNYGLVVKGDLTIHGGTFLAEGIYGIGVTGSLTVNGGNFGYIGANDYLIGSWGTTVINGGNFNGQYNCVNGFAGTVTINGGNFETEETDCTGEYESVDVEGNTTITGGTFSKDVTDYLAEGYCLAQENGKYVVGQHVFGEPLYTWNAVNACTASRNCGHCGTVETAEATVTVETLDATCTEDGKITYTATFDVAWAEAQTTEVIIPATGHSYTAVVTAPTCTTAGYTTYTCACGHSYIADVVEATGHSYTSEVTKEATCTEEGEMTYTCACGDSYTEAIPMIAHIYGEPSYHWSADHSLCVATRACACGHVETALATVTTETEAATCTEEGKITYTATFDAAWAEAQTAEETITATGHTYGATEYTWSVDYTTCIATRTCACGHEETDEAVVTANVFDATCTEDGYIVYTAHFTAEWAENQTKQEAGQPASGHTYGETVYVWSTDYSVCTAIRTCACGDFQREMAEATGVVTDATCTADGYTTYAVTFTAQWAEAQTVVVAGQKATGHSYTAVVTAPTCTEAGYTTYTCACGETYVADYVEPLGHTYEAVVTAPTCTEAGYTTYTCTCGHSYISDYVDTLGHFDATDDNDHICDREGCDFVCGGHVYVDGSCDCGATLYSGWYTDEHGTTYLVYEQMVYFNEWVELEGESYYFDAEGYIVKDIYLIRGVLFAFDKETGVFLNDYTGVYVTGTEKTYYVENGIVNREAGLVRVMENGEAHYYYFCYNAEKCNMAGCPCDGSAVKNGVHWTEDNNGLLVKWDYTFDANGIIVYDPAYATYAEPHHEVVTYDGVMYYTIDGIKVHYGLFQDADGKYYYARSSGALVTDRAYYITDTNGLLPADSYLFGADGAIIMEATFFTGSDGIYYYKDGVLNYGGLIQVNGDYYYVRSNGQLVTGRTYWITKTNGLMPEKAYTFDATGKMVLEQAEEEDTTTGGIVNVDGVLYYYKDGQPYYAGLIEIDGYFYYVRTNGQLVVGKTYWITKTNDLMAEKAYTFDSQGRMILE